MTAVDLYRQDVRAIAICTVFFDIIVASRHAVSPVAAERMLLDNNNNNIHFAIIIICAVSLVWDSERIDRNIIYHCNRIPVVHDIIYFFEPTDQLPYILLYTFDICFDSSFMWLYRIRYRNFNFNFFFWIGQSSRKVRAQCNATHGRLITINRLRFWFRKRLYGGRRWVKVAYTFNIIFAHNWKSVTKLIAALFYVNEKY